MAEVPSGEPPHPFMNQAYAGFMELRVPTSIPAHATDRVSKLLDAEGVELRSNVNGMRTADPATRKPYPPPRPVAVWLLMRRRRHADSVGVAQTGTCPNEGDFLDGFAHVFASHAEGDTPLQRHIRGGVACGDDALKVARAHNVSSFEGSALLVVTHVSSVPNGGGAGAGAQPFCVLYQLNTDRVTLSAPMRRGDPPAATWKDADDQKPRQFVDLAQLFQAVLVNVSKLGGFVMPPEIYKPLAPMAPNAFCQHVAAAARDFRALLDAAPVVRHTPCMPKETQLCAAGVMLRITPWRSLHNATQHQFADTARNAHLDEHERRHITSMQRFERDAYPAMLLCAKGTETVARNYAAEFWSLRPLRGASEENAWMHVAYMRVRPLSVHGDLSVYGAYGVAGEPIGEGVLGQRHFALVPVNEVDIAQQFCVQPCSQSTFVPRNSDCNTMRAYSVAMKAFADFVDRDCVTGYYRPFISPLLPATFDGVERVAHPDASPTETSLQSLCGRGVYKRPHSDVEGAMVGHMLLPFDLFSTRTTVGEACAFVGVKGHSVVGGVRELVFAMLSHSGASASLCAALKSHAQISNAYMECGCDAPEIRRLRRVDVASRRLGGPAEKTQQKDGAQ